MVSYVKHLEQLAAAASIREKGKKLKKKIEEAKTYKEYNWPDLIDSGKLNKIKVKELDKYLLKHNLSTANKKADKVKRITAHYSLTNDKVAKQMSNDSDSKSALEYDSESDSDEDNDDEVLAVIDDSSDQDSTVESDEADDIREAVVHSKLSRSGRRVGSWMDRFQDSYVM